MSKDARRVRCNVCGYIMDSEVFDKCPKCSAPAALFESVEPEEQEKKNCWECSICGYIFEGEEAPERCPECGVGGDLFEETGAPQKASKDSN